MEDKKKGSSPNIEHADVDLSFLPSSEEDTSTDEEKTTVDGIPIAEEDIEYHAKDIKDKDESELFVKVEGAEKIAKKKEREAKKKDEELTKRLLHAAGEKKKAYKKAEDDKKAAKHKAKSWVRQYKVKKVWKKVKPFRAPIAITLAVIIVVGSSYGIITGIIIPNRIARENAEREAANAKLVEDNRTDMIRLFSKLAGKELKEDEVDTLVKEMHNDIRTTLYREDEEGFIEHEGGKSEFIRFSLIEKDSLTFATRFYYISSLDGKAVKIYGGENGYYYVNGNDFRESSNLNELIEDYILAMVKGKE